MVGKALSPARGYDHLPRETRAIARYGGRPRKRRGPAPLVVVVTIHNANHYREQRDGLKVGGHQASCASITAIMTAFYFGALRPKDKVAVKPHAGPVLHAIHYMLGQQSLDALQRYGGLCGAQSYPSWTKDVIPVDDSTGSVGPGVAVTVFASLIQDYLITHGNSPLIGIGQPELIYFEPEFVDELTLIMRCSFDHLQAEDGGSVYLRLTTRSIAQVERADDGWQEPALKGGYWLRAPSGAVDLAIAFTGAVTPEVLAAAAELAEDVPGLGLLMVTSPDLLHRDWLASQAAGWTGKPRGNCHAEKRVGALAPGGSLVTIIDVAPSTLSWLGGVTGLRVSPLGTDRFGQTGDLPDLFDLHRLDARAIVDAVVQVILDRA